MPDTRRLDDTAGRIEGGLYIHIGRVQQDRVFGLDHGGRAPAGVARVPTLDIGQHLFEADVEAARRQLSPAARRAHLGRRGDEQFGGGVGGGVPAAVTPGAAG